MKSFSFALLFSACTSTLFAIDFSPQYAESVQDGFPVKRLYFSEKQQRIYLAVPNDWRVSGDGQHGTFRPAKFAQASVVLENSSRGAEVPFDEKGFDYYRSAARALVPAGATDIQVAFEQVNSLPINGWTSFELAFTYDLQAQHFAKSIIFLNLDTERQIQMRIEAHREDFDKVYGQARGILSSWFAPSPELEAALQRLGTKS